MLALRLLQGVPPRSLSPRAKMGAGWQVEIVDSVVARRVVVDEAKGFPSCFHLGDIA